MPCLPLDCFQFPHYERSYGLANILPLSEESVHLNSHRGTVRSAVRWKQAVLGTSLSAEKGLGCTYKKSASHLAWPRLSWLVCRCF